MKKRGKEEEEEKMRLKRTSIVIIKLVTGISRNSIVCVK